MSVDSRKIVKELSGLVLDIIAFICSIAVLFGLLVHVMDSLTAHNTESLLYSAAFVVIILILSGINQKLRIIARESDEG